MNITKPIETKPLRLATVAELVGIEPYSRLFTKSSLRHLIYNAEDVTDSRGRILLHGNGLARAGALLRIGRKVLFDLDQFDAWLLSHRVTPVGGENV